MPAKRVSSDHQSHRGSAQIKRSKPSGDNKEIWVVKGLRGSYPPLTVQSRTVIDPCRGKVYLYGGYIDGDKYESPTSNFHMFDTKTMKFTDLTNALTCVTLNSSAMPAKRRQSLPSLCQPGLALLELEGQSIIFMFGGYSIEDPEGPSTALIAVNAEDKEWSIVKFEEENLPLPAALINPVLVGIQRRLYIFSGIAEFQEPWTYHRTYSIVDFWYEGSSLKAKWEAVDVPFPEMIPRNKVFGRGVPVLNGEMILLLPGRLRYKKRIQYRRDGFFYFIVKNNTFLQAKVKGVLPKNIAWDFAYNYDPSLSAPAGLPISGSPPSVIVPSVLICTWIPYGDQYLSPELWQYTVFPKDTFVKLGICRRIYELEKDFQLFSLIGQRGFIMGWGDKERREGQRDAPVVKKEEGVKVESGSEDERDVGEAVMCNTYVEIPVETLLPPRIRIEE